MTVCHRARLMTLGLLLCSTGVSAQESEPPPRIVELIGLLGSADAEARAKAGKELLAAGPVALRAVLDAAAGPNAIVAEEARRVLTLAGPEAIDSIRAAGFFNSYDRPWRPHEASAAVARMGDRILPRMLEVFTTANPAGDDWAFAVGVLRQLGDRAAEPLILLLKHPKPEVRREAGKLLSQRTGQRVYAALMEGLRSDDAAVRAYSADGLGNIGDRRASPALLEALHDHHWTVRQAAAAALGKMHEDRFLDPLARLARADEEKNVRLTASSVLMYSSSNPTSVRLGRRYRPFSISPADEPVIFLRFALRIGLTGVVMLVLAVLLARRAARSGDLMPWLFVAGAACVAGGAGFLWGRVVVHIWYLVENLLLFGLVPLVAVAGCLPPQDLGSRAKRRAIQAWFITVASFYGGYGVGWLALWGYLRG